ncbi:MAG TPA: glycosyltransferase, partial [Candidatus Paceibacterota bacterium]
YEEIVGKEVIDRIKEKTKKFHKKRIACISSTNKGGGVAEILNSIVLLFNTIGIEFDWKIIQGNPDFFEVTKAIHNGLQGNGSYLSEDMKNNYLDINERFALSNHLDHDLVIVHDPQPLPLINFYKKNQPWIWRCHIDISDPNPETWDFLKQYIEKYDRMIISTEQYRKNLEIKQNIISPAIDPLSPKNVPLSESAIDTILSNIGIDLKRPFIAQVSRYDKWKDPLGVISVYEKVKKEFDCDLVLLGNIVTDDPEGVRVYDDIIKRYSHRRDIHLLINVADNDRVVNAVQSRARVIIQKSIKEGFGLIVAEAMYKGTPIVASSVGGIPLQIIDGENGFLHNPRDEEGFKTS